MAETMKLQVITPDKEFFHGDVSMVELNTADGELGVYPQHIPLTTAAAPGVLKIHQDGQVKKAALLSGFLQILPPGPRRRFSVRWCGFHWWRSTKNTFSYPGQGALIFL